MFCNWDIIQKRQKNDQIIVLNLNDRPIAFVTWYRQDKIVELEIIWSIPAERNKGYGLTFLELLIKEFKKRGDIALTLYCATNDGLDLAERGGFQPQSNYADFNNENLQPGQQAKYIRILKNTDPLYPEDDDLVILCYEEYNDDDSFFCQISLNSDFEKKPTYIFVDESWECKIIYKNKIIHEAKLWRILKDLKISVYNNKVALFNHNIQIPAYWIK